MRKMKKKNVKRTNSRSLQNLLYENAKFILRNLYLFKFSSREFFSWLLLFVFCCCVCLVPSTVPQANSLNERLDAIVCVRFFSFHGIWTKLFFHFLLLIFSLFFSCFFFVATCLGSLSFRDICYCWESFQFIVIVVVVVHITCCVYVCAYTYDTVTDSHTTISPLNVCRFEIVE